MSLTLGVLVLLCAPLGCGGDVVGAKPSQDVRPLYWALTLDQHAITLDSLPPYDTVRIRATPRTISGDTISGLPPVTYVSTDLKVVRVSADGLVQALKSTNGTPVPVIATLTVGEYTHADTALVNVTTEPTPPTLVSFSIHPVPPNSARLALGGPFFSSATTLNVYTLDSGGDSIPGLLVDFRSSDPSIATIDRRTGEINGIAPGSVTFIASATAYGVVKADTLLFTLTAPLSAGIEIAHPFLGASNWVFTTPEVTIEAGGVVGWGSPSAGLLEPVLVDVVFDAPTQAAADQAYCLPQGLPLFGVPCDGGDIPAFGDTASVWPFSVVLNLRTRQFLVPGTYPFHSPRLNASGTIHVIHTP